ncbi:MAG TPA: hypothetical protein VF351_03280, partial [Actinomycetota bacterium]
MNATEQEIRRLIPGPSWFLSGAAASAFVGFLVAVNVRVVFPDGSGEPAMLGFATMLGLFAVLALVGIAAGHVLAGLAALAADPS